MKVFFWIALIVLFSSCYDTDLDATEIVGSYDLDYLDETYPKSNIPNDPYRILSIRPTSDHTWSVVTEFSGGCWDHYFYTWWSGSTISTTPKSINLHFFHDGQEDMCEAIVRDTIEIDLDIALQGTYDGETVIHVINETISQSIAVDPFITEYAMNNGCSIPAELKNTVCGQGIWEDKWLSLVDSVAYHKQIWLQPVRDVSGLTTPGIGDYQVGVSILFGYEVPSGAANCLSLPDGTYYPVIVQCIEAE